MENKVYYTLGCVTSSEEQPLSLSSASEAGKADSVVSPPRTPTKNDTAHALDTKHISLTPPLDVYKKLVASTSSATKTFGPDCGTRTYSGLGQGSGAVSMPYIKSNDSGHNSMEYWDYSMELEMLNGPADLQLAAELGKTLLERNKALEATIQQHEKVAEEHVLEIEYLSKQTAAMREANDSRLQIYEQIEISVDRLEKENQRYIDEAEFNKRKMKNFLNTIESIETRNEELQRQLEEARTATSSAADRGRDKRRAELMDDTLHRRSASCEQSSQDDSDELINSLRSQLQESQAKLGRETEHREETERDLCTLSEEFQSLQQQVAALQDQLDSPRTLDEELRELDMSTASQRHCTKCKECLDDIASSPTVYDLSESMLSVDDDSQVYTPSQRSKFALVRLKNGGMAYGSQESLASLGQIVSQSGSNVTSPDRDDRDIMEPSICSEFNLKYMNLIDKYENMKATAEECKEKLKQHELMLLNQQAQNCTQNHSTFISSDAEQLSGPMSLVMTNNAPCGTTLNCQGCANCSCGASSHQRPKSNMEEYSEVETSSSGFSEGESRLINKTTQTEYYQQDKLEDVTPTEFVATFARFLDLKSPVNPCDKRFNSTPEYKKLFNEIFTVLKETVHANESKCIEALDGVTNENRPITETASDNSSIIDNEISAHTVEASSTQSECTTGNSFCPTLSDKQEAVHMLKNASNALNSEIDRKSPVCSHAVTISDKDVSTSNILKVIRPNSLDLISNASSRSSSKNRRRKNKSQNRKPIESDNVDENHKTEIVPAKTLTDSAVQETISQDPRPVETKSSVLCTKHRSSNKKKSRRNKSVSNAAPQQSSNVSQSEITQPLVTKSGPAVSPTSSCSSYVKERPYPKMQVPKNNFSRSSGDSRRSSQRRLQISQEFWGQQARSTEYYRQQQKSHQQQHRPAHQAHRQQVAPPAPPTSKSNNPPASVQIAQLISLDLTYADVLKQMPSFKSTRRVVRS